MPVSIRSQRQQSAPPSEYPTVTNGLTKYPVKLKTYHAEIQLEDNED